MFVTARDGIHHTVETRRGFHAEDRPGSVLDLDDGRYRHGPQALGVRVADDLGLQPETDRRPGKFTGGGRIVIQGGMLGKLRGGRQNAMLAGDLRHRHETPAEQREGIHLRHSDLSPHVHNAVHRTDDADRQAWQPFASDVVDRQDRKEHDPAD